MTLYFGSKVEDIFNTMPARFRPDQVDGVNVTIGYRIQGEGGGQWMITIKDNTLQVKTVPGDMPPCTVILSADTEAFVGGTLGKTDLGESLASGRLKVDGDIGVFIGIIPKAFEKFTPVTRAADIIASLPDRFRADKAADVSVKFGYDLSGESGGQWTIVILSQTCTVKDGLDADCAVILRMSETTFVDLNLGRLDTTTAFTSGQVKIDGDMGAAGATAKYFHKFEAGEEHEQVEELISLKCVPSINQRFATGPYMGRWFAGLKNKKFYASKCPACGRTQIPPREVCAWCRRRTNEYIEVGPKGVLNTADIVYYASPDPLSGKVRSTPYATIFLVIDGCSPGEVFAHELNPADIPRIKPGVRVRPVWADETTGSYKDLLYFEIDD